jgi:hypothetical protein
MWECARRPGIKREPHLGQAVVTAFEIAFLLFQRPMNVPDALLKHSFQLKEVAALKRS